MNGYLDMIWGGLLIRLQSLARLPPKFLIPIQKTGNGAEGPREGSSLPEDEGGDFPTSRERRLWCTRRPSFQRKNRGT